MKATQLISGFIIGLVAATLGAYLFVAVYTEFNLFSDFQLLRNFGILGKIITIGALLNIAAFLLLLRQRRENMAWGVVFATIFLTLFTIIL